MVPFYQLEIRCTFAAKIFQEWKNEIFRRREIFGVV
jgi:hypothetical protein